MILLLILIPAGTLVQMLTKGQMLILKSGEDVDLQCEFFSEDFSLFDNPIFWRKAQRMEESQINMMGNLLEPFSSAKRFQATFQKLQPRFIFGLSIHGRPKHSFNMICWIQN